MSEKMFKLPNNLQGRSLHVKVIPTVCNLENMLHKLIDALGDNSKLKRWETVSYKAYKIEDIKSKIMNSPSSEWRDIIRKHILNNKPSYFGAGCIDIYLVAYVTETFGTEKEIFFKYIKDNKISEKFNSSNAIWQVGRGDGVYLGILNKDGTVKDWDFIKQWVGEN